MAGFDPDKQSRDALNRGAGAYSTPGVDAPFKLEDFKPRTSRPAVKFKLTDVDPPSELYLEQTDRLNGSYATSLTVPIEVDVAGRFLRAEDGVISPFAYPFIGVGGRVPTSFFLDLGEGYLLGISTTPRVRSPRGQFYSNLGVIRGTAAGQPALDQLISDYSSPFHAAHWPGGEQVGSVEGTGLTRSITGTTPAAGAEISESVPTNAMWALKMGSFSLTTSATVANRTVRIVIDDGVNILFEAAATFLQVASTTVRYSFFQVAVYSSDGLGFVNIPIPQDNQLFQAWRWRTVTAGLQVGDQYTAPQYNVEEWIAAQ